MSKHGGNIIATAKELGCQVSDLIDMSSNLTPLGMVPGLRQVIEQGLQQIAYLPETESETLRGLFAARFGLKENQVLVGNGTTEFIFALPWAFSDRRAVIVNPTYSDYQLACSWANVEVVDFMLERDRDFQLDLNRLAAQFRGGELVFLCNPNNPTGVLTPSRQLRDFIVSHPQTFFLVDESYLPFTRDTSLLSLDLPANLFVLFSSSKIYGIPGLRLGFLVSRAANLKKFSELRKPWGVNRIAQMAGEYLLTHGETYAERVRDFLEKERPWFAGQLAKIPGIEVVPGDANFILNRLSGKMNAWQLRDKMLAKRIMIRNCANFEGLDDFFFRVSLKERKNNEACINALSEICAER
ncbi:MAG: aminotransferase class I/II-fold pyridoxal phosphate-dependent enzyme [Pseudomonadota bacterium]